MSTRIRQAVLGFLTDLFGQGLSMGANLLATPIILAFTSPSLYGVWLTSLSVIGVLTLLDMGIAVSLTRLVAAYTSRSNEREMNYLISSAFFSLLLAGVAFATVGLAFVPYIPSWFHISAEDTDVVTWTFGMLVVAGAINLPLSTFSAIIVGHQCMAIDNSIKSGTTLFSLVLSLCLLATGMGVMALGMANVISVIIAGALSYIIAIRCLPSLTINPRLVRRGDLAALWTFGGNLQVVRIGNTIAIESDRLLIATILGPALVTPYALTSRLASLIGIQIASKAPNAMLPAMSQMFAEGDHAGLRRIFLGLTVLSARLGVVGGAFVAIVNQVFVTLWVGPEMFGGAALNAVFVYWILQDSLYRGITAVVLASGTLRPWAIVSLAEGALNLGATLLLVGPLGLVGVALGTSISKTITTGIAVPYWLCRKLDVPVNRFLRLGVFGPVIRSLPGVGVTAFAATLIPVQVGWIWVAIVGLLLVGTNVVSFEGMRLIRLGRYPGQADLRDLMMVPQVD